MPKRHHKEKDVVEALNNARNQDNEALEEDKADFDEAFGDHAE